MFEMREGFKSCRHHMKDRPFFASENLHRDLECGLRFAPSNVEHLRLAIAMVLDELVGAMTMILVDAAVRRQHVLDFEFLNF